VSVLNPIIKYSCHCRANQDFGITTLSKTMMQHFDQIFKSLGPAMVLFITQGSHI